MSESKPCSLPPKDWEKFFQTAMVRVEELNVCKSERSKAIKIGLFLSPLVGREVPIQVKGRTGRAVLRMEQGSAKEKRYFFEVTWDDAGAKDAAATPPAKDTKEPAAAKNAKKKTAAKGDKKTKTKTKQPTGPEPGEKKSAAQKKTKQSAEAEPGEKKTAAQKKTRKPAAGNDVDW